MIHHLLEILGQWMIDLQQSWGYAGIVLLMAIESACIPLPSEVIMPFSGYLASQGIFNIWGAALAGSVGCLLGGWIAYAAGYYGGRPFVNKYGRYILLNPSDVDTAEKLFAKHGEIIAFTGRLLPVVRTFIALPAGMARMNFWKFSIYSFLGSFPFCFGLAYLGMKMGSHWNSLRDYFHKADLLIGFVIIVGLVFWVRHHLLFLKSTKPLKKI